jgi:hypothetical protein
MISGLGEGCSDLVRRIREICCNRNVNGVRLRKLDPEGSGG